jgi:hypothetical protein
MAVSDADRIAPCWFAEHSTGRRTLEIPTTYIPPGLPESYREQIWGDAAR